MSPALGRLFLGLPGFPCVSGDEPSAVSYVQQLPSFSPRERG